MDENFSILFVKEILSNVYNYHLFNKDFERFDISAFERAIEITKSIIIFVLRKLFKLTPLKKKFNRDNKKFYKIAKNFTSYEKLFNHLEDEPSRQLLVKILAYRILGRTRVKMPLNTPAYWKRRKHMHTLVVDTLSHKSGIAGMKIKVLDLERIGYDMKILSVPFAAFNIFELKQYEYTDIQGSCKAQYGDVIIDAGGCWGDTAFYFANEVGDKGKVYSFEFIPNNLEIFKKNIEINPQLAERIQIVQQPMWEVSGETFYVADHGPGSILTEDVTPHSQKVKTVSIDDFVNSNSLKKVDFIKMDIEGAELQALKGCIETIKKFRPKLAISVYHKPDDLATIGQFVISLDLQYRLFLGHYTIHKEETILFARPA